MKTQIKHNMIYKWTKLKKNSIQNIQTYILLSTHNKEVCLKSSLIKQNS